MKAQGVQVVDGMRGMGTTLVEFLRRHRRPLGLFAATALILLIGWDLASPANWGADGPRYWSEPAEFMALHTVFANSILTILWVAAAWLFLDARAERREKLVANSTTALGLGGVVVPLLEVAYVMAWLPTNDPSRLPDADALKGLKSVKTKLSTEPDLTKPEPDPWPVDGDWASLGSVTKERPISTCEARVQECLNQIAGSVRDWAPLFTASDLGKRALCGVASLRLDLQELKRALRVEGDGAEDLRRMVFERARLMAFAFEFASFGDNDDVHARSELSIALLDVMSSDELEPVYRSAVMEDTGEARRKARTAAVSHIEAMFASLENSAQNTKESTSVRRT